MSEKKLKTLEEHNRSQVELHKALSETFTMSTGVACPKCGKEMFSENTGTVLASSPPKINVKCRSCDHRDYMVI